MISSTHAAARAHAAAGFTVVPLDGKVPTVKGWQHPPAPDTHLDRIKGNFGIVCGSVSHNLVVIDFDGHANYARFCEVFPGLTATRTILSGSGQGYHVYYFAATLPRSTDAKRGDKDNIELKADGRQVVAPPSIHPVTGQPYTVHHDAPIMRVNDLAAVAAWIEAQRPPKQARPPKPERQKPVTRTPAPAVGAIDTIRNPVRYYAAMLERHFADMKALAEGQRWTRFGEFALPLYSYAKKFNQPREAADTAIRDAYTANGYTAHHDDLESMIESAWNEADANACALELAADAPDRAHRATVPPLTLTAAPDQPLPKPVQAEQPHQPDRDTPRYFPNGLPDSWRAAANRARINVAVLDLIYTMCAALKANRFSMSDLKAYNLSLGYGLPESTLYDFLKRFCDHVFRKLPIDSSDSKGNFRKDRLCFELVPPDAAHTYLLTCVQNRLYEDYHPADDHSGILATPTVRMMESIGEDATIAAELDALYQDIYPQFKDDRLTASTRLTWELKYWKRALNDHHSTPLSSDATKHNAAAYTRSFASAVMPTGQSISKTKIARLLGVSPRTAYTVLKDAGFKGFEVIVPPQPVKNLIEAKVYAKQHAAKMDCLKSYLPDQQGETFKFEGHQTEVEASEFIRQEMERGATVFVEVFAPNKYERVEQPQAETVETAHFAPHLYNPQWVYDQLKLAASCIQAKRYTWRGARLIDQHTGEAYEQPDAKMLIALILNRPLPAPQISDLEHAALLLGGRRTS